MTRSLQEKNNRRALKFAFLVTLPIVFASCGAHRSTPPEDHSRKIEVAKSSEVSKGTTKEEPEVLSKEKIPFSKITENALEYLGTKYKYGGTSQQGMDCSGLVYTAFLKENIALPRTSRDISLQGIRLNLDEVKKGDLLFFQTNKQRKVINHVGLIVDVGEQEIFFVHSTTSRGVIISSLAEKYWQENFVMARRVQ